MTTIAPDPTLAEADVAVFKALVERTVGELGRRRGVLETVGLLDAVLLELAPRLIDCARLSYLDGLGDAEQEDDDEMLDGATRAERAEARGLLAREAFDPIVGAWREAHDELLERSALLWQGLTSFARDVGIDADLLVNAHGAEAFDLRDLGGVAVDPSMVRICRDEYARTCAEAAEELAAVRRHDPAAAEHGPAAETAVEPPESPREPTDGANVCSGLSPTRSEQESPDAAAA